MKSGMIINYIHRLAFDSFDEIYISDPAIKELELSLSALSIFTKIKLSLQF